MMKISEPKRILNVKKKWSLSGTNTAYFWCNIITALPEVTDSRGVVIADDFACKDGVTYYCK
jgi:hypothetical protein